MPRLRRTAALTLLAAAWAGTPVILSATHQAPRPLTARALSEAREYSARHNGLSLLVWQSGRPVFEDYQNGFTAADSHPLLSATKSFCGILLAALIEDGHVTGFDEKVGRAIEEWRVDSSRRDITYRDLLGLTSGLDAGPIGRVVPYKEALAAPVVHKRGLFFQYGPRPFQIFGEAVKRRLKGESPLLFLTRRVFKPIGLEPTGWRLGQDGNPNLASGADLKASEWIKFGELIRRRGAWGSERVLRADLVEELLKPTPLNPSYSLAFWLAADPEVEEGRSALAVRDAGAGIRRLDHAPPPYRIIMAAGAGKQRLYIIDELALVIVRQGRASAFNDAEFLELLLRPGEKS